MNKVNKLIYHIIIIVKFKIKIKIQNIYLQEGYKKTFLHVILLLKRF